MNKIIFATMLAFLFINVQYAQQTYNYSSSNTGIITFPVNASWSHTVSLNSAYVAESYIAHALGQQYYGKYVSFYGGASYGNTSYIYFTYNVPFSNGTNPYGSRNQLGITVTVRSGNVTGYVGPQRPYFVSVSSMQAVASAEKYGFANVTAELAGVFNSSSLIPFSYYSVLWSIASSNLTNRSFYNAAYVDVNSGNVIGEYLSNSILLSRIDSQGYAVISNLTVPSVSLHSSESTLISGFSDPNLWYVLIAFVIAVILALIAVHMSRKEN